MYKTQQMSYCIPGHKYRYIVKFTYVSVGVLRGKEVTVEKIFEYTHPITNPPLSFDIVKSGYRTLFLDEMNKKLERKSLPYHIKDIHDISFECI